MDKSKKVEKTIGTSLWQKLNSEDKKFLVKASNMFNLGKKVDIIRIFRSMRQSY